MIEGGRRDRGKLADDVRFSRWFYSGEDHDFLVYEVSYPESYNQPIRRLYVAAPTDENVKGRYHQHTDALLLASGAWTKELDDEIYVFDDARWEKSRAYILEWLRLWTPGRCPQHLSSTYSSSKL